jgi:hypothetical protein
MEMIDEERLQILIDKQDIPSESDAGRHMIL